jgi:WD40 repeat protein
MWRLIMVKYRQLNPLHPTTTHTVLTPLLLFCHSTAVDREGRYMVTAGLDSYIKIWDLRTYSCLHSYCTSQPATSLDISDTNLLAMTVNRSVEVLKDAFTKPSELTYLRHTIRTPNASLSSGGGVTASTRFLASSIQAVCVKFRPYEDVLAVGHTHGLSTVIVPGESIILSRTTMLLFFSSMIHFQSLPHLILCYLSSYILYHILSYLISSFAFIFFVS